MAIRATSADSAFRNSGLMHHDYLTFPLTIRNPHVDREMIWWLLDYRNSIKKQHLIGDCHQSMADEFVLSLPSGQLTGKVLHAEFKRTIYFHQIIDFVKPDRAVLSPCAGETWHMT